ncbi:MAG TPA: efflux RND transporter permease subunit [Chthoniobacterales bacterium]|nr:efflux RND transporter permease subunit [Chthoniobacterales bacterium]
MSHLPSSEIKSGGLAQYCVAHRGVTWAALIAVLLWGAISFTKLGQQEDPSIPQRVGLLVTQFPGATASKVEELVTKALERKVSELESVEEIISRSRPGLSTLQIKLRPGSYSYIDLQWEKLRDKAHEVVVPQGCQEPFLASDFGTTITLLFGIASPPASDAECIARANLIRAQLADLRRDKPAAKRAAVVAFFPASIAQSYREFIGRRFKTALDATGLAAKVETRQGQSFLIADITTDASRAELEKFIAGFTRAATGTDQENHPDFAAPLLLMEGEDPLPFVRASAPPRYSYRALEDAADDFEDDLKQVESVGKVTRIGVVPETIYLLYSSASAAGYGLAPEAIAKAIADRNAIIPGGTLRVEGQNFPVQLSGEFHSEEELLGTVVGIGKAGAPVYLRDIFEVRRMYEAPIQFKVDTFQRAHAGAPLREQRAVMVAVEMKVGNIIGRFNDAVQGAAEKLRQRLPEGMEIQTLSDQPTAVEHRLHHFIRSFIEAVVIVVLVALLLMDWRSALVVAAAIPLTVAITVGGMHLFGIQLHQISIAALIIALGMLVDDPVVASDAINRELHHKEPPARAAWIGPFRMRRAILYGTVINIVAFLPLMLLPGDTGAFVFGIPAVVTMALIASRVVSMTFIPLLGFYLLRGQKGLEEGGEVRRFFPFSWIDGGLRAALPRYRASLEASLKRPWLVIILTYGLLVLSFGLTKFFGTQFFPPAERNQMLIDIELPAAASLSSMRQTTDEVMTQLKQHDEIMSAALFSGGTAPRFYYNVEPRAPANNLAQILVNSRTQDDVPPLLVKLRAELDRNVAGARCIVKQLEQGPPIGAPIQVRFSGENLDVLRGLTDQGAAAIRAAGGYHVYDDLGFRTPNLALEIDQDRANSLGISNQQIGQIAQTAFGGLQITQLREGDHLIPVSVRLRVEERNEAEKIRALYVHSATQHPVPFASFAEIKLAPEFAVISHYNQLRAVTVNSYTPAGELSSALLDRARPALAAIKLPPGYNLEIAGEDKELKKGQGEMGGVIIISLALIAIVMVLQFNSVSKAFVVLLTVPLGLIGAFTGLAVTHSPLGFMALLGIVSLAGVIVSHIIVLSDFVEEAREAGMPLEQALVQAGLVRLRAVLVTVLATVGGLLPLFLTGGALWHSLTAVHIFGLLLATILTLLLLPVLYFVFCARLKWIK